MSPGEINMGYSGHSEEGTRSKTKGKRKDRLNKDQWTETQVTRKEDEIHRTITGEITKKKVKIITQEVEVRKTNHENL